MMTAMEDRMMKKVCWIVLLAVFAFSSCANKPTGNVKIFLRDAPIDADSIRVTFSSVDAHATGGGWLPVSTEMKTVDLILLRDHEERIADVDLEDGSYTEIRLITATGKIVVNGQTFDLVIPSNEVKIPARFDIIKGGKAEIHLDFDADKSIEVHPTGGGNEYILRPVITVVSITQ